jgi:hypothetical protein
MGKRHGDEEETNRKPGGRDSSPPGGCHGQVTAILFANIAP